ncbi:hypothetical protein TNCV_2786921 [Trichonephila clavipes]|nr:hypothetical protein TNCV_2786921 [Trichonephila clavipes]
MSPVWHSQIETHEIHCGMGLENVPRIYNSKHCLLPWQRSRYLSLLNDKDQRHMRIAAISTREAVLYQVTVTINAERSTDVMVSMYQPNIFSSAYTSNKLLAAVPLLGSPRKRKSKGLRPSNRPTTSNPPPGICNMDVVTHRNRKICWSNILINHSFRCAVVSTPYSNSKRNGKFAYVQTPAALPRHSESSHSFRHPPRLAHRPPHDYYYKFQPTKHGLRPHALFLFVVFVLPTITTLNFSVEFGNTLYMNE